MKLALAIELFIWLLLGALVCLVLALLVLGVE